MALPVWANAMLTVNPYSHLGSGVVEIVMEAYYNFKVVRDDNFVVRRIARS